MSFSLSVKNLTKDDQHDSSFLSRDQGTIYRQDRKWGPDLVSQVLRALLTTKFLKLW